jgi:4a-hydroxytetrahydrobiopterin dehydratase
MATQLSDIEIQRSLGSLPGWSRRGNALVKQFVRPSFLEGIEWVRQVALVAEELDHHPDIDIRYTKITIGCSTHSAGGITAKDVELAQRIDEL